MEFFLLVSITNIVSLCGYHVIEWIDHQKFFIIDLKHVKLIKILDTKGKYGEFVMMSYW